MDLLGEAVGNIGLPYEDFCGLTPDEFTHIHKAYHSEREAQYKDNWERMRMLATIAVQPYAKGQIKPQKLLPLPWDKETPTRKNHIEHVSKEEALKRFEEVLKKAGNA